MAVQHHIARTTQEAYVAIDPDTALPSGDDRYIPLMKARGTTEVAQDEHDAEIIDRLLALDYANDKRWMALHPCVEASSRFQRYTRAAHEEKRD